MDKNTLFNKMDELVNNFFDEVNYCDNRSREDNGDHAFWLGKSVGWEHAAEHLSEVFNEWKKEINEWERSQVNESAS